MPAFQRFACSCVCVIWHFIYCCLCLSFTSHINSHHMKLNWIHVNILPKQYSNGTATCKLFHFISHFHFVSSSIANFNLSFSFDGSEEEYLLRGYKSCFVFIGVQKLLNVRFSCLKEQVIVVLRHIHSMNLRQRRSSKNGKKNKNKKRVLPVIFIRMHNLCHWRVQVNIVYQIFDVAFSHSLSPTNKSRPR